MKTIFIFLFFFATIQTFSQTEITEDVKSMVDSPLMYSYGEIESHNYDAVYVFEARMGDRIYLEQDSFFVYIDPPHYNCKDINLVSTGRKFFVTMVCGEEFAFDLLKKSWSIKENNKWVTYVRPVASVTGHDGTGPLGSN